MGKWFEEYKYLRTQIENSIKSNLELLENKTAVFEGEFYDSLSYDICAPMSNMGWDNPITKVSLIDNGSGVIMINFQNGSSVNSIFFALTDLSNLADFIDGYVEYKFKKKEDNQ